MGFAPFSKAPVIGVGPRAGVSAQVSPQVDGVTQGFDTMPAHLDSMDGAGLITDGSGPGVTLKDLRRFKAVAILPQFAQQSRRDFRDGCAAASGGR